VGSRPPPVRRLLLGLFHATEAWRVPEEEVDLLRRDFPDVEVTRTHSKEELEEKVRETEILFSWAPGNALVARGTRLRWIHAPAWEPDLLRALGLPAEEPRIEGVLGPSELGSMLGESDAVVVAAALTPETEGIFDAAAFRQMRRGAWFVNVARGKIVRERDL